MDLDQRLAISYYKPIAAINEPHHVYLVQHQETKKIAIKKVLDVYTSPSMPSYTAILSQVHRGS